MSADAWYDLRGTLFEGAWSLYLIMLLPIDGLGRIADAGWVLADKSAGGVDLGERAVSLSLLPSGRLSAMVSSAFRALAAVGVTLALIVRYDALVSAAVVDVSTRAADPCAAIGGQKWVAPGALRACFESFAVNQTIKENVRLDLTRYPSLKPD